MPPRDGSDDGPQQQAQRIHGQRKPRLLLPHHITVMPPPFVSAMDAKIPCSSRNLITISRTVDDAHATVNAMNPTFPTCCAMRYPYCSDRDANSSGPAAGPRTKRSRRRRPGQRWRGIQ
jgi:hypothetical protein